MGHMVGTLSCDMTYDKVSHYEGEYASTQAEYKQKAGQQKVQLYKGKCPTKNLFSMLDIAAQGQ
jgi:hypothetical protein